MLRWVSVTGLRVRPAACARAVAAAPHRCPRRRRQVNGRSDSEDGELAELHALSVHLFCSVCHKTQAQRISIYTLMGLLAAHPKLRELLNATVSVSLLGRVGGGVLRLDRVLA